MKYTLPLLAAAGFLFASYTVVSSNQPVPIALALVEPASAPFTHFIAGAGIIEAKNESIAIGSPLARLVSKVVVKVGDKISVGTPLFYLDDRETRAELSMRHADFVKAQADVLVAKATLADAQSLFDLANAVSDSRAISGEEILKRRNALAIAKAKVESALAFVQQAQAAELNTETTLERLIVRAPIDGEVLQINIRAGEFASAGALTKPLLIVGDLKSFHVRVDIDENDAWRFNKTAKAVAYLRGNRNFKVDLQLAYIEPLVVPKKSLTGDSTERVDTRVLQALYQFNPKDLPAYIGQQMDIFIEANDTSAGT
ncbi:MAG: efflux RND transporter periplasmic adaptor subunit [Methylococcales bacterium]|nr:efflux RND transporter periplasmic adaptor subunit [Methylococcales bacterium]